MFQTKIVPSDPISAADKSKTLKRINEVIRHRLVCSKIPPEFNSMKIGINKNMKISNNFFNTIFHLKHSIFCAKLEILFHFLGDGKLALRVEHEFEVNILLLLLFILI